MNHSEGADAAMSGGGASLLLFGGFKLLVLKKPVSWPGISAKTLWASISWGACRNTAKRESVASDIFVKADFNKNKKSGVLFYSFLYHNNEGI